MKIDIDQILKSKIPRYEAFIPSMFKKWLKKIVHQDEINEILAEAEMLPPQQFIHYLFKRWNITYEIEGLDKIDPAGRYIFASNHPFGGMDGMMIADKLIDKFGDVRVVVNDLLCNVTPLLPLWIPINKHGRQTPESVTAFDTAFSSDLPILTFPSGNCSRKIKGEVTDLVWKTNFIKRAQHYDRKIVPMFVEGELSARFYRIYTVRKAFGININIEMLYLVDEMMNQRGRHFVIRVGEPVSASSLDGSLLDKVAQVRKMSYALKK